MIDIFGSKVKSLEVFSLISGIRPVIRQCFYDDEIRQVEEFCFKNNLSLVKSKFKVTPVEKGYSNKGLLSADGGMSFIYISKDELLANKAAYFEITRDHIGLGLILGYPKCCCNFFKERFPIRSKSDNNYDIDVLEASPKSRYPFQNNIFLREKDYCLLSHFPCSLSCGRSIMLADRYLKILSEFDSLQSSILISKLKCNVYGKTFF